MAATRPTQVTLAGGDCVLGTAGEKSFRVDWARVRAAEPEVVVCAPCGYGLEQSADLAETLACSGVLPPEVPVWAVDANASFARAAARYRASHRSSSGRTGNQMKPA